jgi:hypothetical protein
MNEAPYSENDSVTPVNIFTKIWTSPRQVFEFINAHRYDKYVTILLVLSGISRAFDQAATKHIGNHLPLFWVIMFCLIAGALLGWISFYFYAALVSVTGRWLDGKGNTQSILRILSYAMAPTIVALILLIPQIAVYGNGIFQSDGDLESAGVLGNSIFYFSVGVELVLSIWTIVFCVIGISVVQKISTGKAILNMLLPVVLIIVIGVILFLALDLITGGM